MGRAPAKHGMSRPDKEVSRGTVGKNFFLNPPNGNFLSMIQIQSLYARKYHPVASNLRTYIFIYYYLVGKLNQNFLVNIEKTPIYVLVFDDRQ